MRRSGRGHLRRQMSGTPRMLRVYSLLVPTVNFCITSTLTDPFHGGAVVSPPLPPAALTTGASTVQMGIPNRRRLRLLLVRRPRLSLTRLALVGKGQ
ncbi:hypothetical protein BDZ89DRAFT_343264 [Hymenopellis radicata]|nr:hypothetical protein BDZ89DRAFT_343264 [Hymenopellis radicata]